MAEPATPITDTDPVSTEAAAGRFSETRQSVKDSGVKLRDQATEKVRTLADTGKAKATDALGTLSQLLTDAAGQVDEKLGDDYGKYARSAADRVQSFSSSLDETTIDEMLETSREFVRKSPAIALGAAAAVGFVVARLLTAGLDQRDSDGG